MNQLQSYNNSGLFRSKKYSISSQRKKKYGRLFIRRSKIYHDSARLRHRRVRRKFCNGGGDQKLTPSSSHEQKHIDFTELEHIFDNAIRNPLPTEQYKENPCLILTQQENVHTPKLDARIELPVEDIPCCFIHHIKQHKIISAIIFVSLSALIGFFSVWIFVK